MRQSRGLVAGQLGQNVITLYIRSISTEANNRLYQVKLLYSSCQYLRPCCTKTACTNNKVIPWNYIIHNVKILQRNHVKEMVPLTDETFTRTRGSSHVLGSIEVSRERREKRRTRSNKQSRFVNTRAGKYKSETHGYVGLSWFSWCRAQPPIQ